jgi:hypothetical protein
MTLSAMAAIGQKAPITQRSNFAPEGHIPPAETMHSVST